MTEQQQEPTRALTIRERSSSFTPGGPISAAEWSAYAEIGATIGSTEFVKKELRGKPPAIMACLLYGREQGIGPMTSLQEIDMIDGKPSMSAALMLAKIRAAGHSVSGTMSDQGAVIRGKRHDGDEMEFAFTLDMARRAGLTGKQAWQKYPEAMCWARCVSQLARVLFSDVFIGATYTPEERGAEVDQDGHVVIEHPQQGQPVVDVPEQEALAATAPQGQEVVEHDQEPEAAPQEAPQTPPAEEPAEPSSAPGSAAEAARRAQEAAQAHQPPEDSGGAVDGEEVAQERVTDELSPDERAHLEAIRAEGELPITEIELAERAEAERADLPIPVPELTKANIDALKREDAIKYLKHFGVPFDVKDRVNVYRSMIFAFIEAKARQEAAGVGDDDPWAESETAESLEAEAFAEAEAEARSHRLDQLTRVMKWSEENGDRFTLDALRARSEQFFGRQIENVDDLTNEEAEQVWRAVPEDVKDRALT